MMMLIKCAVDGENADVEMLSALTPEETVTLYKLAKHHEMIHLVGTALLKTDIHVDENIKARYNNNIYAQAYRCEQIKYAYESVSELFEENKLPYMPLKGTVIRNMYPQGWMRTSCDIDVLVHDGDFENAVELLKKNGYTANEAVTKHDITFDTPNGIKLELHYDLIEKEHISLPTEVLKTAWEHSCVTDGKKYEYVMSDGMMSFYHISHMAKHFVEGGCGVKPLLDLYVIKKSGHYDCDETRKLLKDGGLDTFAEKAIKLCEAWFSDGGLDETTKIMQDYILSGGVSGTVTTQYVTQQKKQGGKKKYILSRIFIPYNDMKRRYPTLEKHKILLPFCHVHRWFSLLFGKNKETRKDYMNLSNKKTQAFDTLMKDLKLD